MSENLLDVEKQTDQALKECLPGAEITLITSAAGSLAAPLLPWIDDGMIYPHAWQGMTDSSGSALFHFLPSPAEDLHQVDRNLKLLEALDIYEPNYQVELRAPEEIEKSTRALMAENGITGDTPYIVLAPGASLPSEQYAPDYFAAVAHLLAAQSELQLVIVGSAEDAETIEPVLRLAQENLYGNVHSLVGKTTIPELAAVLRQAALTISNKSPAMHIAEAWNCPLIVIYPGTDRIAAWKPRNSSTRLLTRPESCSLCSNTNCPYGMRCLDIRPEEVAIAALEMIAARAYEPVARGIFQEYKSEILSR